MKIILKEDINYQKNTIVIIGHMGSGKSLVGKKLAEALNWLHFDSDKIIVTHKSIINLLKDLRYMAENSSLNYKVIPLRRDVLERADEIYKNKFFTLNKRIVSSFDLITMIAWK